MQIGIAQLIGGLVAIALLIGGAFAVGLKMDDAGSAETAAAVSALDSESTDSESLEADKEIPVPESAPLYKVLRVVDGDTIVIEVNGKSESVRMIGVDTPELNDSREGVQCFAKEASEKTKGLVTGKNIRLEKDSSQGERDKYKRLLGYVFLENGGFVNKELIAEGYGHEYTYDSAYKYQAQFKAAEKAAREDEKGLWAPEACASFEASAKAKKEPAKPTAKTSNTSQAAAAAAAQPIQTPPQQPTAMSVPTPAPQPAPAPQPQPTPAPAPKTEPPPPQPQTNGSIICSTNTYNCGDFKTQKEAQEVYDQCGGVGHDVHKLDNNKDGSACDSLP